MKQKLINIKVKPQTVKELNLLAAYTDLFLYDAAHQAIHEAMLRAAKVRAK